MSDLATLLVLLAITVVSPPIAVRLRIPAAVMLIAAGIGAGPSGLGLVRETPAVAFVSELGFLVLMFAAGMEIDFTALRAAGRSALLWPCLMVAGFFAMAGALGAWMHLGIVDMLVVSACSVGMPLAVLQENAALQTPVGRTVLLTVSIGEFASILALTVFEVFAHQGTVVERAVRLGKVALLFTVSIMLIRWARALVWWYPEPFRRVVDHHDVAELGVRVGMTTMLAFVALASLMGVEAILGAFIAGAMVGFVLNEKHALEQKMGALGHGLFIPVFFVVVGVRFDLRALDAGAMRAAAVLVLVSAAVKLVPALLFSGRELGLRDRLAGGALMAAPLTLVVAIGGIGKQLGVIDDSRQASIVLVAVVLSLVFPTLFRALIGAPRPAPERLAG